MTLRLILSFYILSAPLVSAEERPACMGAHGLSSALDLNRASAEELERLRGLGVKKAQAIVDYRTRRGRFRQLKHVIRVRGIGRVLFKRLEPCLYVQ